MSIFCNPVTLYNTIQSLVMWMLWIVHITYKYPDLKNLDETKK